MSSATHVNAPELHDLEQRGRLAGIGGWLAFFCVILLLNVIIELAEIRRFAHVPRVVVEDSALLILSSIAGVMLLCRLPSALKWVAILLAAVTTAALLNAAFLLLRLPPPKHVWQQATKQLLPTLWSGMWWAYFHRSVRVRNTFGSHL